MLKGDGLRRGTAELTALRTKIRESPPAEMPSILLLAYTCPVLRDGVIEHHEFKYYYKASQRAHRLDENLY